MDYKLIGAIGVLGLAAGLIGLSFVDKKQTLIRVLEELKHQVFMICMKGAPQFGKQKLRLKKEKQSDNAIQQTLEKKALLTYEKKERLILIKHGITKQQFEKALQKDFVKDKQIVQYKEDIEVMLEDVTGGKTPILSVPSQLKNSLKPSVALELVKNLKVAQLIVLLSEFQKAAKQNPNFTVGDNQQTTNLIRKIDLYNIKVQYLQQHGPKVDSMNHYNFIQIIELYCFESPQFKAKIDKIEYLYSIYSDMMGFEVDIEKMKQQFDKSLNQITEVKQESIIDIKTIEQIQKQTQIVNKVEQTVLEVIDKQEKIQQKIEEIVETQVLKTTDNQEVIDVEQIQQPTTIAVESTESQVVVEKINQAISQTSKQKQQLIEEHRNEEQEIKQQQFVQENERLTDQKFITNIQQNQEKTQEKQK